MARGSDSAQTAANTGNQFANTYGGNAGSVFSFLSPTLMNQAAHPAGMSPTDLAATDTATRQSAGGTQSAAVGQGLLKAMRTRNAGGADAAIEASSRNAGNQATNAALQTRLKNAALKMSQQQGAESELGGLYGTSVGGSNAALGEVANDVNANTNAANESWDWAKFILDPAMAGAGTGAGLAAK